MAAAAKKRLSPDPEALVRDLRNDAGGPYTEMDRYRDFRALFTDSEAGKRVLAEILAWGHIWHSSMDPDPHHTSFQEGERAIALKILASIEVEPTERQTQATKRRA